MGKEQREKKRKELVLELEKHQCEPLLCYEYIWIHLLGAGGGANSQHLGFRTVYVHVSVCANIHFLWTL